MSAGAIFAMGVIVVLLLSIFVWGTIHEMKKATSAVMPFYGEPDAPARVQAWSAAASGEPAGAGRRPISPAATERPLRVLLATNGSEQSDAAVESVAGRPWPPGSLIEVVSVIHAGVPDLPDPQLMLEAAHVQALEAERQRAPERVTRAERRLAGKAGVAISTKILEGDPGRALVDEAERWRADLIVMGSRGHAAAGGQPGSVSLGVLQHAKCSVEIVR